MLHSVLLFSTALSAPAILKELTPPRRRGGLGDKKTTYVRVELGDDRETPDKVLAGKGDDVLAGQNGNDFLYGGKGNDRLEGGRGNDFLDGGSGRDTLHGGEGQDRLTGGRDSDHLSGNGGDDVLEGNAGDDIHIGGKGSDKFFGGVGGDVMWGEAGDDTFFAGDGSDHIRGGDDDDVMFGEDGNDVFWGAAGSDVVHGGSDGDTFYSGAGTDILHVQQDEAIIELWGGAGTVELIHKFDVGRAQGVENWADRIDFPGFVLPGLPSDELEGLLGFDEENNSTTMRIGGRFAVTYYPRRGRIILCKLAAGEESCPRPVYSS